ncbi:SDR family NAD(P)-dependent oxidoreductase, partial [Asticcacaulis taihuensis]|uniref:SDR family NAD(P)-dependent oxidoreductase n=1 Tax=Asticcacaulis taihuensis TaxID=260084 RepID=UPI0039E8FB4D
MSKFFDLSGKVAIVTGGNKGLGAGIALALAEAGADIAVVSTRTETETVEAVKALGGRAIHIAADLTSISPVERIVSTTLSDLGGLDILVNNAGMIRRADSVDFTEADWDAVIDLN